MGLAYGLSIDGNFWEALYLHGSATPTVLGSVGPSSERLPDLIARGHTDLVLKNLARFEPDHPLVKQRFTVVTKCVGAGCGPPPRHATKAQGGTRPTVNRLPDDLDTRTLCAECGGSGECPGCDGQGQAGSNDCGLCDGTGQCEECDGRGYSGEPSDGSGDSGPSSELRQLVRELQQGNERMRQLGRRMFGGES